MPFIQTSTAVIFLVHARRWDFIYSVFKPTVWLCIGCLPILLALPLYLVHKLRLDNTIHARRSEILATIIYETVGNVFRQGILTSSLVEPFLASSLSSADLLKQRSVVHAELIL